MFKIFREPDPGAFLLQFSRNVFLAEFVIAAIITMGFATWEFLEFKFKFSERWKPEALPPVPPPSRQFRAKRFRTLRLPPVLQMIGGILWLAFLCTQLSAVFSPWFWAGKGAVVPSPALYAMRLPLLLLAIVWISQSWLGHTRHATAEWRPLLRIALNLAGLTWAIFLLRSGDLLIPGPNWNPSHSPSIALLNHMFSGFLTVSCISSTLQLALALRDLARRIGKGPGTLASISK